MTTAVLDANVLYGALIRDLLLRLAVHELYRPVWTAEILRELQQALLRNRPSVGADRVTGLLNAMTSYFPDALITPSDADLSRVPLAIDSGDRHVVAAALAAGADLIVTENLRHFPQPALEQLGVSGSSIDDFLCRLLTADREVVKGTLVEISTDYSRPAVTVTELVGTLGRGAPRFAGSIVNEGPALPSQSSS